MALRASVKAWEDDWRESRGWLACRGFVRVASFAARPGTSGGEWTLSFLRRAVGRRGAAFFTARPGTSGGVRTPPAGAVNRLLKMKVTHVTAAAANAGAIKDTRWIWCPLTPRPVGRVAVGDGYGLRTAASASGV